MVLSCSFVMCAGLSHAQQQRTWTEGEKQAYIEKYEQEQEKERMIDDLEDSCQPYLAQELGQDLNADQLKIMCDCLVADLITQKRVRYFNMEQWKAMPVFWRYGRAHDDILRARGLSTPHIDEVAQAGENSLLLLEKPTVRLCIQKEAILQGFIEPPEEQTRR